MPRSKQTLQGKHWCFTINNPKDDQEPLFDPTTMQYLIAGLEKAPTTGTIHLQGYVCLNSRKRLTGVRKLFPHGTHLEKMRGTTEEAIDYCKKDGRWEQKGLKPMSNSTRMHNNNNLNWHTAVQHAKHGEFDMIQPHMLVRYYSAWKRINQDNPFKPKPLTELTNVWIKAPSGYGKSEYARTTYPNHYDKAPNKWFVGYKGEDTILCDDYGPDQCKYLHWYLKRWADLYSFPMETKGGGRQIRPKRVVVTSQYSIQDCFEDIETVDAIERRFTTLELTRWQQRLLKQLQQQDEELTQIQQYNNQWQFRPNQNQNHDDLIVTQTTESIDSDSDLIELTNYDHMEEITLTDLFSPTQ